MSLSIEFKRCTAEKKTNLVVTTFVVAVALADAKGKLVCLR